MKALMMVAHPDDCVIFGHLFYDKHRDLDWHICYLTYDRDHPRSLPYQDYWRGRGVGTTWLGFPDLWGSVKQGHLGFDRDAAIYAIRSQLEGYDLVLTHNSQGEYGHPHHLLIHEAVSSMDKPAVWFGSYPNICNEIIKTSEPLFDPALFPMDEAVIRGFDLMISTYFITPEAESVLKSKHE